MDQAPGPVTTVLQPWAHPVVCGFPLRDKAFGMEECNNAKILSKGRGCANKQKVQPWGEKWETTVCKWSRGGIRGILGPGSGGIGVTTAYFLLVSGYFGLSTSMPRRPFFTATRNSIGPGSPFAWEEIFTFPKWPRAGRTCVPALHLCLVISALASL